MFLRTYFLFFAFRVVLLLARLAVLALFFTGLPFEGILAFFTGFLAAFFTGFFFAGDFFLAAFFFFAVLFKAGFRATADCFFPFPCPAIRFKALPALNHWIWFSLKV